MPESTVRALSACRSKTALSASLTQINVGNVEGVPRRAKE